jgi:hypothetical protein
MSDIEHGWLQKVQPPRVSMTAAWVTLATALLLQACGGGGGGNNAGVVSEALVPDGPSSCTVEAQVYTGPDVIHDPGDTCLVPVYFTLFDPSGNELTATQPLSLEPPERTINFNLRICSGEIGVPIPGRGEGPPGPMSLFLVPNVDHCPSGTTIPGALGDVSLVRPPQEVSCQEFSRVQTTVSACG